MQIKYRIGLFVFKLLARLPLILVQKIAHGIGTLSYYLPLREPHISRVNLRHAMPDLHPKARTKLLKASLAEDSKSLLEASVLWNKSAQEIDQLLSVHGEHHITNTKKNGLIFAVPHMASWEIINLWLSIHHDISSLYRKPNHDSVETLIFAARSQFGATLLHDNLKGVLTLKRALDNKQNICLAPDQDPGHNGGLFAPFFNQPANTSTLIPKLAQKTGATILMTHTIRTSHGFELHITPADSAVYDTDLHRATTALNKEVEKIIAQEPAQYMWSGKRYRSQERGKNIYQKIKHS